MNAPRSEYTFDRVVRMVLTGVVLTGLFLLLRYLSDVLVPFAAAAVMAYLLNPLVTIFERRTKSRGLAVGLTLAGILLIATTVVVIGVPVLAGQIGRFQKSIERLRDDLAASYAARSADTGQDSEPAARNAARPINDRAAEPAPPEILTAEPAQAAAPGSAEKTPLGWTELTQAWAKYREEARAEPPKPRRERLANLRAAVNGTYIGNLVDDAMAFTETERFHELMLNALQSVAVGGLSVVSFFFNLVIGLIGLVIVLVYLVFLLIDFPQYSRSWPSLIPPEYRVQVVDFYTQFNFALRQYFRGQAIVASITGLIVAAGLSVIGMPMALPLGIAVGLFSMVPYMAAVALVPAMMLAGLKAIETDSSFLVMVLLTLGVFGIAQVIQDTLVTPRVMGQATGLRPVAILLGIFIWGKLLGFLGLILAIPLTCLAIAYYRKYVLGQAMEERSVEVVEPATKGRKGKGT